MAENIRLQRLIDHAFTASRWHVHELTDREFFRKPVEKCWGIWKRAEAKRPHVHGTGEWVMDTHGNDSPLVPTIGWRIVHLAMWTDIYREWTFGVRRPRAEEYEIPGTAIEAVAWLERAQDAFLREVHALDAKSIDTLRPTHYGKQRTAGDIVWDIAIEHTHHGAEIGLLRDLIRGRARNDTYPGTWDTPPS
ncbi:MAG: DinB family protein [Actinomycetota bacterium]